MTCRESESGSMRFLLCNDGLQKRKSFSKDEKEEEPDNSLTLAIEKRRLRT
jgi:hypothetical protein